MSSFFTVHATLLLFVLMLAGALSGASAASCAPHDRFSEMLSRKHGERVIGEGTSQGRLVELFRSRAGSWTMLVTFPNGLSCIIAAGEAWEDVAGAETPGEGA